MSGIFKGPEHRLTLDAQDGLELVWWREGASAGDLWHVVKFRVELDNEVLGEWSINGDGCTDWHVGAADGWAHFCGTKDLLRVIAKSPQIAQSELQDTDLEDLDLSDCEVVMAGCGEPSYWPHLQRWLMRKFSVGADKVKLKRVDGLSVSAEIRASDGLWVWSGAFLGVGGAPIEILPEDSTPENSK